jgi:hypothetical protein
MKKALAWCVLCGAFATAWCWSAGHAIGPTYDEKFYIQGGLNNWRNWNHRELLTQGVMPLATEVQTFPLRLAEVFASVDPSENWLEWLPTARLGTIVFFWLLLWSAYQLGSLYSGTLAGCVAVTFLACEPILLGHASLATTDLPFTACLLALLASFRARRDDPHWTRRLLLPAFWVTMTFLAKASALLFVPMSLGMIALEHLLGNGWRPGRNPEAWRPAIAAVRDLALIGLLGIAFLFVVCPRASRGLLYMIRYASQGGGATFLLEQTSATGYRHYFAAALVIKTGLPILIAIATLLFKPRWWLNGPMCAAIGLLALTPTFKLQIGVRHVLPVLALAIVGGSIVAARWWHQLESSRARACLGLLVAGLGLWSLAGAMHVWPNGTCFANGLFGGPGEGYRALSDSNHDWGQGLPELARWQRDCADAPLYLWYFGTDPRAAMTPFHPVTPGAFDGAEDLQKLCKGGYLAVSTSLVYGPYFDLPVGRYLRSLQPIDRTMTYLIFDFR